MSRTSTADVIVANKDGALTSGSFADVEVALEPMEALLLTRDAIIRQEGTGLFYAYVVEGGTAHRRNLILGDGFGESVEVLQGLVSGDRVVTAGRYRLHDGVEVTVVGSESSEAPRGEGDESAAEAAEEDGR